MTQNVWIGISLIIQQESTDRSRKKTSATMAEVYSGACVRVRYLA